MSPKVISDFSCSESERKTEKMGFLAESRDVKDLAGLGSQRSSLFGGLDLALYIANTLVTFEKGPD